MQWLEIRFRFADNKPGLPFSFPACVRFAVTQSVEHGLEPFFQAGVCASCACLNQPAAGRTRRQFLHASGLGALSLFWADWLRASAAGPGTDKQQAKSVILIFNCGAPSHIDLWDPKPHAPDNVRGEFKPIATNVPGIRVSELLPRLAQQADKYAIVRTVHHRHLNHNTGMYWSIVGRPYPIDSTLINPSRTDYPSFGTLVGWLARRDGYSGPLPPYVITPLPHCDSMAYITPGQFGGCLGASTTRSCSGAIRTRRTSRCRPSDSLRA